MDIARLLLFLLPAYFANSSPVVLGGGAPVDLGWKLFDGRRVFGNGKTWKGLVGGIATGTMVGFFVGYFTAGTAYAIYASTRAYVLSAFLLSCGTLFGDLAGSFVKRRLNLASGRPYFLLDQLPFIVFALVFAYAGGLMPPFNALDVVTILILTVALHILFNVLAHGAGLKKVPW